MAQEPDIDVGAITEALNNKDVTLTGFKIQSFSSHIWYSCGLVATT